MTRLFRQVGAVRTEARILIGALIGLIAVGVFITLAAPPPPGTPFSVHSVDRDGAMALRQWLQQDGYRIHELVSDPLRPYSERALFILDPLTGYSPSEIALIQDWVRSGNTLIVAGSPYMMGSLLDAFGVSMASLADSQDAASLDAPTLLDPPLTGALHVEPLYRIDSDRADMVVHLSKGSEPVLVSLGEEQGTVWIAGMTYPFSNQGLHDPNNARLILNLLAGVPKGAEIGFDEAHHGNVETTQSLFSWLVGTAPGWGIILALVLTMVFLALQGRRFGRAVALPSDRLRREPVEYIQAMANLFRRSGQRTAILKHYRDHLRRRLTERYALDPHLDDIELVKTIVFRDPTVDETALRGLLKRLSSSQISEQGLISAALDVDAWLKRLA